jgi:hypothetical protein
VTENQALRAGIARMALAEYEDYHADRGKYAEPGRALDPETTGALATCTGWLLQLLDAAAAAPALTGRANAAVGHLDTRQMRDVLNVLALRVPAAVLDAAAEAGHGHA